MVCLCLLHFCLLLFIAGRSEKCGWQEKTEHVNHRCSCRPCSLLSCTHSPWMHVFLDSFSIFPIILSFFSPSCWLCCLHFFLSGMPLLLWLYLFVICYLGRTLFPSPPLASLSSHLKAWVSWLVSLTNCPQRPWIYRDRACIWTNAHRWYSHSYSKSCPCLAGASTQSTASSFDRCVFFSNNTMMNGPSSQHASRLSLLLPTRHHFQATRPAMEYDGGKHVFWTAADP